MLNDLGIYAHDYDLTQWASGLTGAGWTVEGYTGDDAVNYLQLTHPTGASLYHLGTIDTSGGKYRLVKPPTYAFHWSDSKHPILYDNVTFKNEDYSHTFTLEWGANEGLGTLRMSPTWSGASEMDFALKNENGYMSASDFSMYMADGLYPSKWAVETSTFSPNFINVCSMELDGVVGLLADKIPDGYTLYKPSEMQWAWSGDPSLDRNSVEVITKNGKTHSYPSN
jgi:hypothetical protein